MKTPQKSTTSLTENQSEIQQEIQPKTQSEIQLEDQSEIQSEIQLKNQPPALPLISIIIPVYNAAKFLDQTITSCLKQDYPHLEIILINDGSTDDSKIICEKYQKASAAAPSSSILFFDRPHQGVSATRNFGLDHFSGEYFCFLDADDLLAENFVSTLYTLAKKNNLDYITSGYQRFVGNFPTSEPQNLASARSSKEETQKPESVKSSKKKPRKPKSTKSSRELLRIYDRSDFYKQLLDLNSGFNFCHMKIMSKSLRHIRFDESLSVAEDALYNFKILNELNSFGATPAPLYLYRVHQNSTVRTFSEDYIEKYRKSLQKIGNFLQENQGDLYQKYQNYFYAFVATHLFFILANFCCHKDNKDPQKSIKSLYQIPLFARAIYLTPLRLFPPQKALVLFCFKFKFIFFLSLIGHLRAKQNSK
ncbi:glycosyltransferase family 2 protein [Candidatus Saccharibacteria bacterium]|nr:glycosyltransferase family 2 protein [Candidatus Saccharibacteria bacterium]